MSVAEISSFTTPTARGPHVPLAIVIRAARATEGAVIHDLQRNSGGGVEIADLDWSDIGQNWLIAEHDGYPVGAVCVLLGKPVSYVPEMFVDRTVPHRVQALAVRELVRCAKLAARLAGSQLIGCVIPHDLASYRKVAEHRGAVKYYDGSIYVIRS